MKKLLLLLALILLPQIASAQVAPFISNGLTALWTFDGKDTPGRALDRSGNGNTAYLRNVATSTFYKPGKIGQGFDFDGTNDSVSLTANLFGTGADTVSVWMFPRSNGGSSASRVVSDGLTQMWIAGTGQVLFSSDGVTSLQCSGGSLNDFAYNEWSMVTVTRASNGTATCYVNGRQIGSGNSGTPAAGASVTTIGDYSVGAGLQFNGMIDDVRIYSRELSADEIRQLYNYGSAVFLTPPSITRGLSAWWTFDGKDMQPGIRDRSGAGQVAYYPANVATTTTPGKIGQAISYSGVIATGVTINPAITTGTSFTYAAWVYERSRIGYGNLFAQANSAGVWMSSGKLNYYYGVDHLSAGTVPLNTWTHIAVVVDGGNVSYYINGVQDANTFTSAPGFNATGMGCDGGNSGECFTGFHDDVRFYNRALSAEEIRQLSGSGLAVDPTTKGDGRGLIGWWSFDGKTIVNGAVRDSSGQGVNGNFSGISTSTIYRPGKIGQGLNFDGSDDTINFGDVGAFEGLTNFSFGGWFKFTSTPNGIETLGGKFNGNTVNGPFYLAYSTISEAFLMTTCAPNNVTCANAIYGGVLPTSINDGKWHHLMATYDGANTRIYFDGAIGGTVGSLTGATVDSAVAFTLGSSAAVNDNFPGMLDDMRFYNRTLSQAEIRNLIINGLNPTNK